MHVILHTSRGGSVVIDGATILLGGVFGNGTTPDIAMAVMLQP
jgi:hypothetical protein